MSYSCIGKERFQSFGLADRVRRLRRGNSKLARMVYRCSVCAGYHLGSSLSLQTRVRGQDPVTARETEAA